MAQVTKSTTYTVVLTQEEIEILVDALGDEPDSELLNTQKATDLYVALSSAHPPAQSL